MIKQPSTPYVLSTAVIVIKSIPDRRNASLTHISKKNKESAKREVLSSESQLVNCYELFDFIRTLNKYFLFVVQGGQRQSQCHIHCFLPQQDEETVTVII